MKTFVAFIFGNITGAVLIGLCYRYGFDRVIPVLVMIGIGIVTLTCAVAPLFVTNEKDH